MLHSLHIRNYILIDALDIEFPEGLVIITGQTGAGKSILLGALSLLSGAKADASLIQEGADSCVVEAEFAGQDEALGALLAEADVEADGDSLLIRRVVSRSGRSRSFINDCPVQVGLLQQVAERLVDIHSQHKSLLLTDPHFQLSVLDHFAGNGARLASCREAWRALQDLRARLAAERERLARLQADRDYNEAQWRQLDEAKLIPGELESLEEEQRGLAHAEQIKEALERSLSLLEPEGETPGVVAALKESARQLERITNFLPSLSELQARLESARIEVDDILSEIDALDRRVDLSPGRLEQVEERMSLLYTLLKKHNCTTIDELVAVRERYNEALFDATAADDRIHDLEQAAGEAEGRYRAVCAELAVSRRKAAPGFAAAITESLRFLELDRAVFDVAVVAAPESATGTDKVSYLFSATGREPADVAKCASGGELSRIMLSLKAMMARFIGMPTLIFDEIDTGISGMVANAVAEKMRALGRKHQVLCVTHLPQIAAYADTQYVAYKFSDAEKTHSITRRLTEAERPKEIARIMGSGENDAAAMEHAKKLLQTARS